MKDLRPWLESRINDGVDFSEIEEDIDNLNLPRELRDALWVWARAYAELRPQSIFKPKLPA